jgi:hypothetical protein
VKTFLLRLEPSMHRDLERWAKRERRSMQAHLRYILRKALAGGRGR